MTAYESVSVHVYSFLLVHAVCHGGHRLVDDAKTVIWEFITPCVSHYVQDTSARSTAAQSPCNPDELLLDGDSLVITREGMMPPPERSSSHTWTK
jgi:hypothetical protein